MPDSLLRILNVFLLALLLLFFLRVLRAVWVQVKSPPLAAPPAGTGQSGAGPARATPPPADATNGSGRDLRLRIIEPAGERGRVYELGDEVTVGRSPGCGVALADSTVSQLHARLFRRDGRLWVEDLGSTNGTWLNRAPVSSAVPVRRGDRLQVGGTVLEVSK